MKRSILILGLFLMFTTIGYSQKEVPQFDTYHKNIYGEFLGSHLLSGGNFDMRLKKGKMDGIGFRAGIGGIKTTFHDQTTEVKLGIVTFPLEFNHIIGKKRSSFITGVGLIPVYATIQADGKLINYKYAKKDGFGLIGGFLTMGYRFQPKTTGLMFQINWNPLILQNSGFNAGWFGIGLGMGFK